MDFRCDQSKGMHFIYLLPFSKKTALVESTMFSKHLESNNFYDKAILKYLKKYYNLKSFTKSNHEKGIIPMHDVSLMSKNRFNIGTRGGAVRPSTGYAFTFIQKQVLQIKDQLISGKKINTNIHSKIDLFLDKIFIRVIDKYPEIAPTIFSNLAQNINGDEMARFMSGNCDFKTNLKIIFSMPKIPFIKSFFKIIFK
jgi:lycopene beta-cyclase